MSKRIWFVTVGVPGGQYAVRAENLSFAMRLIVITEGRVPPPTSGHVPIETCPPVTVRPASPELVEWLEGKPDKVEVIHIDEFRCKVEGGWLYDWVSQENNKSRVSATRAYVPVALASGITVIEEEGNDD